jgi:hypothetical protein
MKIAAMPVAIVIGAITIFCAGHCETPAAWPSMALAATMTAPSNISDDLYARLRNQFSEEQLMQLSAQIAFENYRARWNRVFDVGSDDLYRPTQAGPA